jgi:hypothetical protein
VLLAGLGVLAGGLLLLAGAPVEPRYVVDVLPALVVMGVGIGVVLPAIIMLAMAGAEPRETGLVSGLTNTAQQAGGALGLAVLAVVAARVSAARLASGAAEVAALRDGYSRAYLTAAGFALGALVMSALALRRPPRTGAGSAAIGGGRGGNPAGHDGDVAGGPGNEPVRDAGGGTTTPAEPVPFEPPLCRK